MEALPRVALVTGAGSGIGRACAQKFFAAGFRVVLAGRRREALEETARASGAGTEVALVMPTDITDPAAVRALFARTKEVFGRLDVLFNNAGINVPAAPLEDVAI